MPIQDPEFRFEIIAFDKRNTLSHAPIGWQDVEFTGETVELYKVVRRVFSSSLKYILEAKDILRAVFFTQGINGAAILSVDRFNTTTYKYENIVLADFDFSTYNEDEEGVTIKTMERGIASNLVAYEGVTYELPIDREPEAVTINLGSLSVDESASFSSLEVYAFSLNALVAPALIIESDTTSDELCVPSNVTYYTGPSVGGIQEFATYNAALTTQFTGSASVRIGIDQNWPPNTQGRLFVFIRDVGENISYLVKTLYYNQANGRYQTFTFDFAQSVVTTEDSRFIFYYAYGQPIGDNPDSAPGFFIDALAATMNLQYNAYEDDYICKGLRPMTALRGLMQKMNPNLSVECVSNILSTAPWNRLVITSGDSIRAIPGAMLKTNFEDYFKSYDAQLWLGMDIVGNKAVVEYFPFFRNQFVTKADIGNIKNLRLEPDLKYSYSNIKVGYENQEYRTLQGKDEQNTLESWTVSSTVTNTTRSQTTKDLTSPYRADIRGIDQLIIDFRQNKNQDTKSDNEVFFLFLKEEPEEDGSYKPEGVEPYAKVEGLASLDRSYNIILSPRHMLFRHSAELAIQFALAKEGKIEFQSSAKNANMVLTYNDGRVFRERDPISYDQMSAPAFLPVIATVEESLTDQEHAEIVGDQTNYGVIKFYDRNKLYKGFIEMDAFAIHSKESKEIKFSLSIDNSFIN